MKKHLTSSTVTCANRIRSLVRLFQSSLLIAVVIPAIIGCGRTNPVPSPLPEITVPADASGELRQALESLTSNDPKRRALAIVELGELAGGESTAPFVVKALEDPNHLVRARAAQVLGKIGDTASIALLINRLEDQREDRDVRARAAEALGQLKATEAVEPLVDAMGDMFWHLRHHAIIALGRIGDRRAEGALQRAAEYDPDFQNRQDALQILHDWQSQPST